MALLAAAILIFLSVPARPAITLEVLGSWTESIDAVDLIAGAGSDLTDSYESASNAIEVNITSSGTSWQMDIRKVDGNWHGDFVLYARRTADGTGVGTISGGDAYQQITGVDNLFFSGTKGRTGVNVQLKLSGVSIQVPPDTYITTVYYTITETA